jgi:hypothetical protein
MLFFVECQTVQVSAAALIDSAPQTRIIHSVRAFVGFGVQTLDRLTRA